MEISVVVPVYGCRAALRELHGRLSAALQEITDSYEIILVDDCCPQGSWEDICGICRKDAKVTGVQLSRNFGQARAITAGLDRSSGKWVVVMDCDLQDRPENIRKLYEKAQEGYDAVFAKRKNRKDSAATVFLSKCFYRAYNYFTDGAYDGDLCNFSIISRTVADYYCSMREQSRAYIFFIRWLGFQEAVVELEGDARLEGKSSYSMRKKAAFALELITAQSDRPLYFAVKAGFAIALAAAFYIAYIVLRHLIAEDVMIGWTSIAASVYLMGGILLCALGVAGIYIGRIFEETKKRPVYAVRQVLNDHGNMENK